MRPFANGNTAVVELTARSEEVEALRELDGLELDQVSGGYGGAGVVRVVVINPTMVNP